MICQNYSLLWWNDKWFCRYVLVFQLNLLPPSSGYMLQRKMMMGGSRFLWNSGTNLPNHASRKNIILIFTIITISHLPKWSISLKFCGYSFTLPKHTEIYFLQFTDMLIHNFALSMNQLHLSNWKIDYEKVMRLSNNM
jgi:hypothetical protein